MCNHKSFMEKAIQLACDNLRQGKGGPFGCLVVKDGEIIAAQGNSVTSDNDPTAHAEVNAIRVACHKLNTFQLSDCTIYSSCEPCPMCLGAIYWARPKEVFFAATKADAATAGFDDSFIYSQLSLPLGDRSIPQMKIEGVDSLQPFREWLLLNEKLNY